MARGTLAEPGIQQALTNRARVAVDIDEHSDLASQYGISAVPTFVLLAANGEEVQRTTGFQPPGEFLQWLTNGISAAGAAMAHQAMARKKLAEVDRFLGSTNMDEVRQSAAMLFDLCAERNEQIVGQAAERLRSLAVEQPVALLDGLIDPRLPTRIQVANVLRARLGDSFDVDPWSELVVRAVAIQKWRTRLEPLLPIREGKPLECCRRDCASPSVACPGFIARRGLAPGEPISSSAAASFP